MRLRCDKGKALRQTTRIRVGVIIVACAVAIATLTAGCSNTDEEPARVVLGYAEGLEVALRGESLDGVRPYATPANVERVRLYVTQLAGEERLLDVALVELEVLETSPSSKSEGWVVEAVEQWTSKPKGSRQSEPEIYEQLVRYTLVTVDGRLLVDEVEELGAP